MKGDGGAEVDYQSVKTMDACVLKDAKGIPGKNYVWSFMGY